jgi:probable rRNA maturation factor
MIRLTVRPGATLGLPVSPLELRRLAERVLAALGLEEARLDLLLVDDREIAGLNRAFLGLPGPTNVLSFPAGQGEGGKSDGEGLGGIALSADTLLREAALYGQDPAEHLVRLLAHGVLHLAGHDHGEIMDSLTEVAIEAARAGETGGRDR